MIKQILLFTLLMISVLTNAQDLLWVNAFGGIEDDAPINIISDDLGNIYSVGSFRETVDFDPGSNNYYLTANSDVDSFILKLDPEGNFVWAKSIEGDIRDVLINELGSLILIGTFTETVDFNLDEGTYNVSSNGEHDIFILKLNDNGEFLWVKTIGGEDDEYSVIESITIDENGNLYFIGNFNSEIVDFDPGSNVYNLFSNGTRNIFFLKLDNEGNFIWANNISSNNSIKAHAIASDTSGNTFITGDFVDTVDFNPGVGVFNLTCNGAKDIYLLKLDLNGNFEWVYSFGSDSVDWESGYSVTTDLLGNPILTGKFAETVDFDPGAGLAQFTVNGYKDFFILKLTTNGEYLWARTMGGPGYDSGTTINTDDFGNILISGVYQLNVDLDPSEGISNNTSNGGFDIFIMKLSDLTLGIEDNDLMQNLSFSPNPTNGKISLSLGKIFQKTEITITTILGKTTSKKTVYNTNKIDIEINGQPGVYFCNIIFDEKIKKTIKIIKN